MAIEVPSWRTVSQSGDDRTMRKDRRAAFERLAMPHARALHRTAQRLTGRADDASDVVQETFLRAYRTFDGFRPGTNEKAWLFTILYSILANRWQAARRAPGEVIVDDLDARVVGSLAAVDPDAEQQLLQQLGATPEIHQALSTLPEVYRAAVLLVDVEQLTYEETAAVLDCAVGTVRSRLARGRRLLYTSLVDYARRTGLLRETAS
jgi:RNA polymerase sigma-70 factor (ECF subfamily)